ncbi:hypothetical protein B0H11DRAFT_2241464 [Mycena galericulata]|nr:hypothetical protein B0H11DRAFT_2241464 [Mycena galericulata]
MSESPYLRDYEKHLGQLKAHFSGSTGEPLSSSFIPPAAYWTALEKDLFFHALAVHSRLRPDLIAYSLKSKNVLDVCAYIDVLDRAARHGQVSSLRSTVESAMEVSDAWIQHEEVQASALMKAETEWEQEAEESRRSVLLASRFQEEQTYWSWKEEQERQWGKQDTLAKLGRHHLRVLHKLIRNADAPSETEPPVAQPPSRVQDPPIDPASSSAEPPPPITQHHFSPQGPMRTPEHSPDSSAPPLPSSPVASSCPTNLSPTSRRRLQNRLYMRKKRAQALNTEPNLTPILLPRGIKTRNVYVSKSRPKKYKTRKHKNQEQDLNIEHAEVDVQDLNVNAESATPPETIDSRYKKGGIKEQVRIMATLKDHGIDKKKLAEEGFDIFNLSKLCQLMGLFRHAYAGPDEEPIASSISADTVKLLRAILLDFTSNVAHRAISLREQEVVLKHNYKVWRLIKEDEITSENVLDALQMEGLSRHNLLTDSLEGGNEDSPQDDDEREEPDDHAARRSLEQQFVEDELLHARLPLHRELVPPFVQFSQKTDVGSLMSTETNIDDLMAELDDESELDELDRQLEARYQADLWLGSKG